MNDETVMERARREGKHVLVYNPADGKPHTTGLLNDELTIVQGSKNCPRGKLYWLDPSKILRTELSRLATGSPGAQALPRGAL